MATVFGLFRDDLEVRIGVDGTLEVHIRTVDLGRHGSLRQPGADRSGHGQRRDSVVVFVDRSIREGQPDRHLIVLFRDWGLEEYPSAFVG